MATSNYNLDINKQAIIKPLVILRQGDYGMDTMRVSLSVANEAMDLTGATVKFMGTTAGGHQIIDETHVKIIDVTGGVFEYVFPSEAAGDIGEYKVAYFLITQANGRSSTMDFRVQVLSGVDISAPVASNYISHYDTMVSNLNSAYDSATSAANNQVAATVSSLASSAAAKLDSALSTVNTINSTANNASSAASKAVSMAASVASAVTSQASYINSVASSAASNVSSVAATVIDKIDNLSIGGRNYLLNSSGINASSSARPLLKGSSSNYVGLLNYLDVGIQLSNDKGNQEWFYELATAFTNISATPLIAGNTYTISFKAKGTAKQVAARVGVKNTATNAEYSLVNFTDINNSDWTKVKYTFSIAEGIDKFFLRLQGAVGNNYKNGFVGGETITFKEVKLEAGNVATDWTPAPEDAPFNDANVVHKTGNETIAGDKTFSGNTTFSAGIKGGEVNLPASGDLNTLTDTGKYYQNVSVNAANWSNRPSNSPNLAFSVDVIGHANRSLVTQVYYVHTTSRAWVRTLWLQGTTLVASDWAELANDANVVHKTGDIMRGTLQIGGKAREGESGTVLNGSGSIELASSTTYIDFHGANDTADFSSRISDDGRGLGATHMNAQTAVIAPVSAHNKAVMNIDTMSGGLPSQTNAVARSMMVHFRDSNSASGTLPPNFTGFGTLLHYGISLSNATQVYYDTNNERAYVRYRASGAWKTWRSLDDLDVVHKTGNETIAGDKTFTGTLVANNPIKAKLSIDMLPQKDLNSATATGQYKIDVTYSNTPSQMPNGAFIDVLNFDDNLIYQVIVARDISDASNKSTMWVRIKLGGNWANWQSISKDDNVVHKTGNETIAGDKTFTGKIAFSGPVANPVITREVSGTNGMRFTFSRTGNYVHVDISGNYAGTNWTSTSNPSYATELFNVDVPAGFAPDDSEQPVIIEYSSAVGFGRCNYNISSNKMSFTYRGMTGNVTGSKWTVSSVSYTTSDYLP